MPNRLEGILESAFPTPEPASELVYRLESVARIVGARRRRRRNWGLFGLLVLSLGAWRLENPVRAVVALSEAKMVGSEPVRNDSGWGGPVRTMTWMSGSSHRERDLVHGTETLVVGDVRYRSYPANKWIVKETLSSESQPESGGIQTRHGNPWSYLWSILALCLYPPSIERLELDGRPVDRVLSRLGASGRSITDIDSETHLIRSLVMQANMDGTWKVVDKETISPAGSLPRDFFSPTSLARAPMVDSAEAKASLTKALLSSNLGQALVGAQSPITIRSVCMTQRGDIPFCFTGPTLPAFEDFHLTATDDKGRRYFQATGISASRGQEGLDGGLQQGVFVPYRTFPPSVPLKLQIQAHVVNGNLVAPVLEPGSRTNPTGRLRWPSGTSVLTIAQVEVKNITGDLPIFAPLFNDYLPDEKFEILRIRETASLHAEDWDAVLDVERELLNEDRASHWDVANHMVAAYVAKGDTLDAENYRRLRNRFDDRPIITMNVWERLFGGHVEVTAY